PGISVSMRRTRPGTRASHGTRGDRNTSPRFNRRESSISLGTTPPPRTPPAPTTGRPKNSMASSPASTSLTSNDDREGAPSPSLHDGRNTEPLGDLLQGLSVC